MRDEGFHLLAGGVAKGLDAAEVGRISLDQVGIELVLANELAEAVANLAGYRSFPLAGCGGSFFDSREDCGGSAKEPISSTEQMPMP